MIHLDQRMRHKFAPCVIALAWITLAWVVMPTSAGARGLAPTEETSIGIFYSPDAPQENRLWRDGDPGERLLLHGRVLDTGGAPVADARVELWQADGAGEVRPDRYRTRLRTRRNGAFSVTTALPGYIPGASGTWGARHIHVVVTHPAYPRLISLIFFKDDPKLAGLPHPDLAVLVERGRVKDEDLQFAEVVLILQSN